MIFMKAKINQIVNLSNRRMLYLVLLANKSWVPSYFLQQQQQYFILSICSCNMNGRVAYLKPKSRNSKLKCVVKGALSWGCSGEGAGDYFP